MWCWENYSINWGNKSMGLRKVRGAIMHVAFGRVHRKIALLRTCFSLRRSGYSESETQCLCSKVPATLTGWSWVSLRSWVYRTDYWIWHVFEILTSAFSVPFYPTYENTETLNWHLWCSHRTDLTAFRVHQCRTRYSLLLNSEFRNSGKLEQLRRHLQRWQSDVR